MLIIEIALLTVIVIWGLCCFFGALFWWDRYSQYPKLFPFAKRYRWQIDTYGWLDYHHGSDAVRKSVLFWSAAIVIIGALTTIGVLQYNTEHGQTKKHTQVSGWNGESVSFAGGALTLEEVIIQKGTATKRFDMNENRYEEFEAEVDLYDDCLLSIKTTLTNNSSDVQSIREADFRFYAEPAEQENNIEGYVEFERYVYDNTGRIDLELYDKYDNLKLDAGEHVTVEFGAFLAKEEQRQPLVFVLQFGREIIKVSPFDFFADM